MAEESHLEVRRMQEEKLRLEVLLREKELELRRCQRKSSISMQSAPGRSIIKSLLLYSTNDV